MKRTRGLALLGVGLAVALAMGPVLMAAGVIKLDQTTGSGAGSTGASVAEPAGESAAEPEGEGAGEAAGEAEYPDALGAFLEQQREATPGDITEEGPASAATAAFEERAYPADTISVAQMNAAAAAFSAADRKLPTGKGKKGTWVSVGPSEALYPGTPLLTSTDYIPNRYVAGGRTTSIAISDTCKPGSCTVYVTPAGGGVWRTRNALTGQPSWQYLGGPLGINAAGFVYLDPNDTSGNTVYIGTGEANICGSGCVAGAGIYKSTDGGDSWTKLGGGTFDGLGVGVIVVKPGSPDTIYAATTTALRGQSSTCCSGVTRPVPGAGQWGLYKSTDGGTNWTFIHDGSVNASSCTGDLNEFNNGGDCSPRGVRALALDPTDPTIVYAGSYARGIWRSNDEGATWTQIRPSLASSNITTRPSIAVTTLPNGKTRMYAYEGAQGSPRSRLERSDDVATGAPVFTNLTSTSTANPGWAWDNLCGSQCWYDQFVYTPKGYPDIVYVGGSYSYGQSTANKRGVVFSDDAGATGYDMTFDGTDPIHPNGLHPDQHAIVTNPNNPYQFFETSDGGIVRSSGDLVDRSSWCDDRGLSGNFLARCQQMLSRIPSKLESLNKGLSTLQFQSLSVSPKNVNVLQGGTQDNGTWQTSGNPSKWQNTMIGDGGQSGFDVAIPTFRFHNFTGASPDVNFNNGNIADWIWIGSPLGDAGSEFYSPMISDPVVSKTLFSGTGLTVYRTKTAGLGTWTVAEANAICNEWTGTGPFGACGDWERLGPTPLTDAAWGDRSGTAMAAIARTTADSSTEWAATTRGRVFITTNVDADPAAAVTWTRLDDDSSASPGRFVSGIAVDPANPNRAFVSYSGYGSNTPSTPGHVFEVVFNGTTSTWADVSHDLGDIPITGIAYDDVTGDLYASNDFGVLRLADGATSWTSAASGMPNVEVAGLTIVPGERVLYAATHGLAAWRLNLPK
jgi:hypothetical protein